MWKLDLEEETANNTNYKPCLTYIHIVVSSTKEAPVKQTAPYVEYVFTFLMTHGLFDHHPILHIVSDGCGKHFKCYLTQAFMAHFQEDMRKRICNELYVSTIFYFPYF